MKFSAEELKKTLSSFDDERRVAFAFASAACQTTNLARYLTHAAHEDDAIELIQQAWIKPAVDRDARLRDQLDAIMELMPDDPDSAALEDIFGEHSLASLAYSVRTRMNDDPQDAVWAAQRAYDAADQAAIKLLRGSGMEDYDEDLIRAHPITQRELKRQQSVLQALASGSQPLATLFDQSFETPLLDESEWRELLRLEQA